MLLFPPPLLIRPLTENDEDDLTKETKMDTPEIQDEIEASAAQSKKVLITAIGTGILFWTSLFGLVFFCLRT